MLKRIATYLTATLVLLSFTPGRASAHAELTSSTPAQGEVLARSPQSLVLEFNEEVVVMSDSMQLVSGGTTATFTVSESVGGFSVKPTSALGDGPWSLVWQVVSADGHLVAGVLSFQVGQGSPGTTTQVAPPAAHTNPVITDRLLELFAWVATWVALGAVLTGRRRVLLSTAALAAVFSGLRLLDMYESLGSNVVQLPEFWAAALVASAALTAGCLTPRVRLVALAVPVSLFSLQGVFSGHHRLLGGTGAVHLAAIASHVVHLIAASLWVAALVAIMLDSSNSVVARSRKLATGAIAALVPSVLVLGAIAMWERTELGRWELTIIAKVLLSVIALGFGAVNHRRTSTVSVSGHRLRQFVAIEIALIAAVAVLTASIATATPSSLTADKPTTHAGELARRDLSVELVFDDGRTGRLELLGLAVPGPATVMLYLTHPDGSSMSDTGSVSQAGLQLSSAEHDVSGMNSTLTPMGNHVMGVAQFPFAGEWDAQVSVVLDEFTSISATATINLDAQGGA